MKKGKHLILREMSDLRTIPEELLSDGDTASGTLEGERVWVRYANVTKLKSGWLLRLRRGDVDGDEDFVWAVMSADEVEQLECTLSERTVIDFTLQLEV